MARIARPTEAPSNVRSYTGNVVHAGAWTWSNNGECWKASPACKKAGITNLSFGTPTDDPITCKRCSK